MKKSVLLPYDQYIYLTEHAAPTPPAQPPTPTKQPLMDSSANADDDDDGENENMTMTTRTGSVDVVNCLQPAVQQNASRLLSYLKHQHNLSWNDKGEVYFKNNPPITNSHICDILRYVTSSNAQELPPTGLEYVLKTVAHIPTSLITNPNLTGGSSIPPGIPAQQRPLVQRSWKEQWRPI